MRKGGEKMEAQKKEKITPDVIQPVVEFAALLRYLKENGMLKEELRMRSLAPGLASIHDKLIGGLEDGALDYFNARVQKAYDGFLDDMDKQLGLWY